MSSKDKTRMYEYPHTDTQWMTLWCFQNNQVSLEVGDTNIGTNSEIHFTSNGEFVKVLKQMLEDVDEYNAF